MQAYLSKSFTLKNVAFVLIILIMATSSFDIFLNLRIGGYSFRFTFLVIVVLMIVLLLKHQLTNKPIYIRVVGLKYLSIWTVFLIVFIPNTTILGRNIGYIIWFLLLLNFMVILPNFIITIKDLHHLIKWYIYSFVWVALFGLIQFVLGLAGIPLLTTQTWAAGLARINGFSYEPSYFVTYLMIAWGMLFFWYSQKKSIDKLHDIYGVNKMFVGTNSIIQFVIITVAIVLSSSRMGILLISLVLASYSFYSLIKLFVSGRVKKRAFWIIIPFMTVLTICMYAFLAYFDRIAFLLAGTGVGGTAAHSSVARFSEFLDTLMAFWRSPIIGYSLGGIPSAIAQVNGDIITTQNEAKDYEGMNVFAETLAASGIIGFLFFTLFIIRLIRCCYQAGKIAKQQENYSMSLVFNGLIIGFLLELIILNFNQTLLRPYVWIHIAIMNTAYFVFVKSQPELIRQNETRKPALIHEAHSSNLSSALVHNRNY